MPVEAVDASGSAVNYQGLDNLCEWAGDGRAGVFALPRRAPERISVASPCLAVALKELQSLWLRHCPHVDDWCLSRLHPLANSLQELSLAGCPRISERGLACLHHLQ